MFNKFWFLRAPDLLNITSGGYTKLPIINMCQHRQFGSEHLQGAELYNRLLSDPTTVRRRVQRGEERSDEELVSGGGISFNFMLKKTSKRGSEPISDQRLAGMRSLRPKRANLGRRPARSGAVYLPVK